MGPLAGIRIIEISGIGPGPFAAMLLADMGADVLRVCRAEEVQPTGLLAPEHDLLYRNRPAIALDLKKPGGAEAVLRLAARADALIEGFRPGVCERLGIGPEACLARNPKLVFGRMTGWGQDGPMAQAAGHDINYLALTGALHAIGRKGDKPVPPLNLVADFGGGAMFLAFGVVCALLEARSSGKGQVVDAAMVDGAGLLMTMFHGFLAGGLWRDTHGVNLLDGGAPFYDVYETKEGRYVSVGALEPKFYATLVEKMGISDQVPAPGAHMNPRSWAEARPVFEAAFKTRTRDEWCALMEATDACFAPVLGIAETPSHAHAKARGGFVDVAGTVQPAPAPRFSRTTPDLPRPASRPGTVDASALLADWGFAEAEIAALKAQGVVL